MLNYGADINLITRTGHNALLAAIKLADQEIIRFMLTNSLPDQLLTRALELIIRSKRLSQISKFYLTQTILEKLHNLDIVNEEGRTLLDIAQAARQEHIIECLVKRGARNQPQTGASLDTTASTINYTKPEVNHTGCRAADPKKELLTEIRNNNRTRIEQIVVTRTSM